MKSILSNPHIVLMVRIIIGLLFIVSSLEKIVDPAAFAQSIADYRLLPAWLPIFISTVLPWVELLCGFSLLLGVFVRGSSLLVTTMLIVFTLAVISALVRGLDISCGCFTQDPTAERIGGIKVFENCMLIALTLFLYFSKTDSFTLYQYLRKSALTEGQTS